MGNKTRLMMRADMRVDLKDSGALWSDTELNRCVDKAFSDLSRHLPDERIYEGSHQFAVTGESVTFPADTNLTAVVNAQSIDVAAGGLLTIAGQPDVPRILRITITDADSSTYGATFIIRGCDRNEQYQEEVFYYTRGDSKTINGKKEFKYIYEVELNQDYGSHSPDTASVGYGAYTDAWIYLANSPIKWGSESATDNASAAIVCNTDFYMDYANGRVKAISGGKISAAEVCTFAYTKSQIGIDISGLTDLIRVQRVEYPVGEIPQSFVPFDVFGKYVVVTGTGESGGQEQMAEDEQYRIYYDAKHNTAGEMSPSTAPTFLEDTVLMAAEAYALFVYALKYEHQAVTDLTSSRAILTDLYADHVVLGTALTNLKKYLDNNSAADAAGLLQDITDNAGELRTAIINALEDAHAYLTAVGAATTGDLALSVLARANYMGTTNYVDGGTAPDIKAYLDTGDATLNTVPVGGEGQDVPRAYREYAQAVKDSLVAAHENDRASYQQNATARTNAAMGFVQEVAQRMSNLRSFIEQAEGYTAIANTFAREAEDRIAKMAQYIAEVNSYVMAATNSMTLSDRFRTEATERRNEVYSIWRDRKAYIGDFTASSVRQMPV